MQDTKRTVLIIDDSLDDIEIMSEILKSDYRIQAAMDSEVAIKILRGIPPPDLILLDIMMPKIDGYQLCRELKGDEPTKAIPIIFVTAKDAIEDEATGFAAGCVDYIVKPVNPLLLRARVKAHVDLKLAREDLEKQNDILRENARLREEVENIIRHDLKSPLMVILNLPEVLKQRYAKNDEHKRYLKMIEDSGRKMLDMINSSIDLYKMENATYKVKFVPVDALHILRQVIDACQISAEGKTVQFKILLGGSSPGEKETFWFKGEELLFYTLCMNLMKNAVEASPRNGNVTISLGGNTVATIAIHNLGVIPEEIRGRFFEKFSTAGKEHGTGLGAYSAKLIVTTLGGSIWFETSEGEGTTVFINLPR